MQWGITIAEQDRRRAAAERERVVKRRTWHPWFAWRPVRLVDGTWCWLEPLERIGWETPSIPLSAPRTGFNRWSFRRPLEEATK